MHVQDVEEHYIRVSTFTAQNMKKSVPAVIRWAILPVFAAADRDQHQQVPLNDSSQPTANAIHLQSPKGDHIHSDVPRFLRVVAI